MPRDVSHLYGIDPGYFFEDYEIPELDAMKQASDFQELLKHLTTDERRCIRYYFQHRRGETTFCIDWLKKIESGMHKINEAAWVKFNQRLAIYDQIDKRYWASITGTDYKGRPISYWSKARSRCFLFVEEKRDWLQDICDRSNKSLKQRRFLVVEVDATKRLGYEKPF